MSLQKMLEYQKIDAKIYRLEKEYNELPEKKEFNKYQSYYKDQAKLVSEGQKDLEKVIDKLKGLLAKAEQLNDKKAELEIKPNNAFKTEEDFVAYEQKLKNYQADIIAISDMANEYQKKLNELSQNNKVCLDHLRKSQDVLSKLYAKIQLRKKAMKEKAKIELPKLKAIKPEIDKDILEMYETRRGHHIFPVFMPYKEPNCSACGIDVSAEVAEKFNKQKFVECPHCRRLLYIID